MLPRRPIRVPYECQQCSLRRAFSQVSIRLQVGPESPRYIDIPEPPQQSIPERPRIRGSLPVPRDIFNGRTKGRGLDKADAENIARATPLPADTTPAKDGSRAAWRQRMAEMRRENLQEGLQELRDRRVRLDTRRAQTGKRRQREREELLHRPEREDERLTTASIDPVLQQVLDGKLQDPDRESRLAEMRRRVEMKENLRREERQDSLHTLYMQARNFITSEAQLDSAIDVAFGKPHAPRLFANEGSSMWNASAPPTVQDLVREARGGEPTSAVDSGMGYSELLNQRVKRMAEELTGGKMDDQRN